MKFDCLLFHGSFLTRVVIGSYNTKGGYVMNTISHRVYQTGEGERESDRPRTSENQAKICQAKSRSETQKMIKCEHLFVQCVVSRFFLQNFNKLP